MSHQVSTHGATPSIEVTLDESKVLDARMKQLENSQQESLSVIHGLKKDINDISLGGNVLAEMLSRLTYVESLLSGFDEVDNASTKTTEELLESSEADNIISSGSHVFDAPYSPKESIDKKFTHEDVHEEINNKDACSDICNDGGKQAPITQSTFYAAHDQNLNINHDSVEGTVRESDEGYVNNSLSLEDRDNLNPSSISGRKVKTPLVDSVVDEINVPAAIIQTTSDILVKGDQADEVGCLSFLHDMPEQYSGWPTMESNEWGGLNSVPRITHFSRSSTRPPVVGNETEMVQSAFIQRSSLPPNSSRPRNRTGTVMLRLEERESQMELSIRELSLQIVEIQAKLSERKYSNESPEQSTETSDWVETTGNLRVQIDEIKTLLHEKVSNRKFDEEIEALREMVEDCVNRPIHTISDEGENVGRDIIHEEILHIKRRLVEQISQLKTNKVDRDDLEVKLCQLEESIKFLLGDEIAKQQLIITNCKESTSGQLDELRSILDSRYNDENLVHEPGFHVAPPTEPLEMSVVDERIQKATAAVRISLEEELTARLEELKCIEKELDGLASKLEEKPSQDQIELMMKKIEHAMAERLGADNTLQLIMENLRLEMKQKMTKQEVLTLVKHAFSEAKVGIQNTKSTLMIGRTSYKCLGCNQSFPGVNGIRAPKVNHDALPPAVPLTPNVSSYHRGSSIRRSTRPVQSFRSVYRPKSAMIAGRFAPTNMTRFSARKYSR